jgi:hypothetical protein
MELIILIIESLTNALLIILLLRAEYKVIQAKKRLIARIKRDQEKAQNLKDGFAKGGTLSSTDEVSPNYEQIYKEEHMNSALKTLENKTSYIQKVGRAERNTKIIPENFLKIEPISQELKNEKDKNITALANVMGINVRDLLKLAEFESFSADRIKRVLDVYLFKPDLFFAIAKSVSSFEVEYARANELRKIKGLEIHQDIQNIINSEKQNVLKCGKKSCIYFDKEQENNCQSMEFKSCQHFVNQE